MHFGIVGSPIWHSLSKNWFECYFKNNNTQASFSMVDIANQSDLYSLILSSDFDGLLVTSPLKAAAFSIADECFTGDIPASNVLTIKRNSFRPVIYAYNTDWLAFRTDLLPLNPDFSKSALIFGTGGAAHAVAYALQSLNIPFKFVSRFVNGNSIAYNELIAEDFSKYSLFVNATPLGRVPYENLYPPINYARIPSGSIAYDLNYDPEMSPFLQKCSQVGCMIRNGRNMVLSVYAEAVKLWNL